MNERYGFTIPLYDDGNTTKTYIQHFNAESIKKINELYKNDFLMFDYKMLSI